MSEAATIRGLEDQFLASVGALGAELGVSRAVAQIYALLYMQEEPLSLDDMADRLGVSKATISVNVRHLERWGAVRRTWIEGSRRDYYLPERDTLQVVWTALRDGILRRLERIESPLSELEQALEGRLQDGGPPGDAASQTLARLREVRRMETRIQKLLSTPDWLRKLLLPKGS